MNFSDSLKHLQRLIRTSEELAALGALARIRAGELVVGKDVEDALVNVMNAVDPDFFEDITNDELTFLGATAYGNLSRLTGLVAEPEKVGSWSYSDPLVLEAQGKSSRAVTRFLSSFASENKQYYEILDRGEAFLDVGSGVGWVSISMAQQWPKITVDGVEILPAALKRAEVNLASSGVQGRVSFQKKSISDLDEVNKYGSIFVPLMFIPENVLRSALPKLRMALRSGGFLFVAGYSIPDDPLVAALNRLQTVISGGRVWTESEIRSLLTESGFELEKNITPNAPLSIYNAR